MSRGDDPRRSGRASSAGTASRNGSSNSGMVSRSGSVDRQRQHDDVELAARELVDQNPGLGFAQFDLQLRIALLELRQHARQHIGRQRRDDPEREMAGQHAAAMLGKVDEVARRRRGTGRCAPRPPARSRSAPPRPGAVRRAARQAAFPARGSAWTAPAGSPSRRRRPGRNADARPARTDISSCFSVITSIR